MSNEVYDKKPQPILQPGDRRKYAFREKVRIESAENKINDTQKVTRFQFQGNGIENGWIARWLVRRGKSPAVPIDQVPWIRFEAGRLIDVGFPFDASEVVGVIVVPPRDGKEVRLTFTMSKVKGE